MKKLIFILLFIFSVFASNSQAVSRATLTTTPYSWNQRLVPIMAKLNSTWASFVNIIDDGQPWSIKGNALGTNTLFIGPTDNRNFDFKTNNTNQFRIETSGLFKIAGVTSSLTLGSHNGDYWMEKTQPNGLGFAYFKPQRRGGGTINDYYFSTKTDSVIYASDVLSEGGNFWDGPWFGTSTAHNVHFIVNMNGGKQPLISVVQTTPTPLFISLVCLNPAVSGYTCDANFRLNEDLFMPYAMKIDTAELVAFAIDSGALGNVLIKNKFMIGTGVSTVVNTPTLHVTGTNSVSGTSTFSDLIAATTMSVGTTSTLTGNTNIGGSFNSGTTLNVVGSMSVSDTPTLTGDVYAVGALSVTTTFSAAGTSILTGNTRIGSAVAPTATLHLAGTMSVSSTCSLNGVTNTGSICACTTFSTGTTNTLVGKTRIGSTTAPTQTLDVTGTMSVSGTSTVNGLVNPSTMSVTSTATIAGNAIITATDAAAYLPTALSTTATLNFASTTAGNSTNLTITVTGASDGDPVIVGYVNASTLANGIFTGYVSATNTVTVRFTNTNLVAALDPASGVFKALVIKN
jgi:hypothetical protein